jgi:hypothetical protein
MVIRVGAHALSGRHLTLPTNRVPFSTPKKVKLSEFIFDPVLIDRESLVANPDAIAAKLTHELFQRFGWDASLPQIHDIQAKMRQRR